MYFWSRVNAVASTSSMSSISGLRAINHQAHYRFVRGGFKERCVLHWGEAQRASFDSLCLREWANGGYVDFALPQGVRFTCGQKRGSFLPFYGVFAKGDN